MIDTPAPTPPPVSARRLAGLLARLDRQAAAPAVEEDLDESDARVLGAVAQHRSRQAR